MAWVRFEDDFYDSPKFDDLSSRAFATWVVSVAYANRRLTDGEIPATSVVLLTPGASSPSNTHRVVRELVDAGLWHRAGHDCEACPQPRGRGFVVIHDYLDYQRPAVEIVEARDERAARRSAAGRIGAAARWARHRERQKIADGGGNRPRTGARAAKRAEATNQ